MPAPAAALARAAFRQALDFALPPRCPGCGAITAEPHRFCPDCWRSLTFLGEPCCAREQGEGDRLLVPVPLHRWRIWKRGYNQAALIASALSRRSGIPAELDLVRRIRATPPLRGLGRRER